MLHISAMSVVVAYLVACFYYFRLLSGSARVSSVGRKVLIVALICHAVFLWLLFEDSAQVTAPTALSIMALGVIILSLIFEYRLKVGILGVFASPLAAILVLFSGVLYHVDAPATGGKFDSKLVIVHLATSVGAQALLTFAFVLSIAIVFKEYFLRLKRFPVLLRKLPSLEVLEQVCWRFIYIGFLLMCIGLITGLTLGFKLHVPHMLLDPHLLWSVLSVFVYTVLYLARLRYGWRGRRAAFLNIAGFVTILISLGGLSLAQSAFHSF